MSITNLDARSTTFQILLSIPKLLFFSYIARVVVNGASIASVIVFVVVVLAIIVAIQIRKSEV